MKNSIAALFGLFFLAMFFWRCNSESEKLAPVVKFSANDPFQHTMVPSQFFALNAAIDNVVEGKNGTKVIMPIGCFKNAMGAIVTDSIKVELSEALSLEDMLLSNLNTTADGKLLETDGMIYFNATANGEQLAINKDIPVHIEIPTNKRKERMQAYEGVRDENGTMNWINPKEINTFLVPVDLQLLDFLPEGFAAEVQKGMPFRNYKTATNALVDSLYYSLSSSNGSELLEGLSPTEFLEPYYDKNIEIKEIDYPIKPASNKNKVQFITVALLQDMADSDTTAYAENCRIDPAIIKVIKNKKFQNTLLSTREFETRLQYLFKTCRNDLIEIYIKNLDKNLWELDSMVAVALGEHNQTKQFENFYRQRLTKVKDGDQYAELLSAYYAQQLQEVKAELEQTKKKLVKELEKQNKIAEKTARKYKKLLNKREKHRMETYGFKWTKMGWINVDRGTIPKTWGSEKLEFYIQNAKNYDRVHAYVIYTSIKSLYSLNSSDGESFFVGSKAEKAVGRSHCHWVQKRHSIFGNKTI